MKHYIEPFFGSGAVLLARPKFDPRIHIETINDKDGFVCNVWRALQAQPDEVARWCDWPVNHADLTARKAAMLKDEDRLLENLVADPAWYDARLAGYWIWAASCWIGSGLTRPNQRPHLSDGGEGVHALGQRPHLGSGGEGVHALGKRPHLGSGGEGVHALGKRPHLAASGQGVQDVYNSNIYSWFRTLSERLRYVRVVCGDWSRVCGGNWQDKEGLCGIFFDPPYGVDDRDPDIYYQDSQEVAGEVREWALAHGNRSSYRIVLAGYYEEHEKLLEHGWRVERWVANGGYANSEDSVSKQNRFREALFFSPHCVEQHEQLAFALGSQNGHTL